MIYLSLIFTLHFPKLEFSKCFHGQENENNRFPDFSFLGGGGYGKRTFLREGVLKKRTKTNKGGRGSKNDKFGRTYFLNGP